MICLFQDFLTSEKIISSHIKITMYNNKKEEINMLSEVIIFIYSHCDTYTKLLKSGHLLPKIYPFGQARVQRDWLCNTHILVQGKRSFVFHFASVFTSNAHQRLCTVSFSFHPPSYPGWFCVMSLGWQRGLLSISLAFVYCWFLFLINFSLCQKANCVLFVSEGVVGELILILSHL